MLGFFCFGRKLNRADSKNRFMTVTRIQKQFFFFFRISKDIVWASAYKAIRDRTQASTAPIRLQRTSTGVFATFMVTPNQDYVMYCVA
jgi:hypothetical protein